MNNFLSMQHIEIKIIFIANPESPFLPTYSTRVCGVTISFRPGLQTSALTGHQTTQTLLKQNPDPYLVFIFIGDSVPNPNVDHMLN